MKAKRPAKKRKPVRTLSLKTKVDRSQLVVETYDTMTPDIHYWLTRSAGERFRALQLLREINYGPAASGRLQRVLEVVTREER